MQRWWRHGWTALVLGLALAPRLAHADPKDEARRHFQLGIESVKASDFDAAIREFKRANEIYPHPNMLYNIAKAAADAGRLEEAIEYFRLYMEAAPEKAGDVEPTVKVLQARLNRNTTPAPEASAATAAAGGVATVEELERLRAIAAELAELSQALAVREPAAPAPATAPVEGAQTTEGTPIVGDVALPGGLDFLSDAYERVVVTASRYGQDPLDSPSTVTVLTEEDIRMSGATNIPDLLRRVVGVDVMSMTAGEPSVSIRGFNREFPNKVLVLIDGRSVYLDLFGTPMWAAVPISLVEIERIEIIRGPGSAVYGANAVTGVINIITRRPGEGGNLLFAEGGSPGYAQGAAVTSGHVGAHAYRLSAGYQQTGAWSLEQPTEEDGAWQSTLGDTDLSLQVVRANGRIDRTFGRKGFASLSGGYVTGKNEFYVIGTFGDWNFDFQSGYARADLSYGPVHLRTFYNTASGTPVPLAHFAGGRDLSTRLDHDVYDVELETLQDFQTGPISHKLNLGVGYRYKSIAWTFLDADLKPVLEHHFDAFAQEQATIGPVNLVGSLRIDKHPLVPLKRTISPRAAAIVRVADKTSVRATGGTSFRQPTFMESYSDLAQPGPVDGVYIDTQGSEELLPERISTVEVGVHDESTNFHRADVAAYYNHVSDLIFVTGLDAQTNFYDSEDNGFDVGTVYFTNLTARYDAWGVEAEGHTFPVDGVDIYANVDVQRIIEKDGGVSVPDGSTSTLKINGGAIYRSPFRVDVAAHVHYLSSQTWRLREVDEEGQIVIREAEVPARTIASARLAGRPFADDKLELAVSAWNIGSLITGEGFREHPKGQLVTSRVFGTATYHF